MTISAAALAATLLVGNAVDTALHDSGITFARSEVVPIEGVNGMLVIPALTKHAGDITTLGIAVPKLGAVLFVSFDCGRRTFAINGVGMVSESAGDRLAINDIEPPTSKHATDMTPISEAADHWLAVENVACGKPT